MWQQPRHFTFTHWGRDKMDATSQTTYSNAFSWMKIFDFRFKISLKFVPMSLISNIPALVQIMAWRRPGDKPLSEPMMVNLSTHICVTRPQLVNVTLINKVKEAYSNCKWVWYPAKSCLKETIPMQFFVFILCMHYINWARQYPCISTQTKDFPISYINFPY